MNKKGHEISPRYRARVADFVSSYIREQLNHASRQTPDTPQNRKPSNLYQYMYGIYRYSKWLNNSPDQLIKACQDEDGDPKPKALAQTSRLLDDFIANLQAKNQGRQKREMSNLR